MKKISLFATIADSLLAAACAFVIIFTAVRFYTKNPALGLGLGAAAFALFGALAFLRLNSKRGKAVALGKKQIRRRAAKLYLCSLKRDEALSLLNIAIDGKINRNGIEKESKIYLPEFLPEQLSPNDICGAKEVDGKLEKVIICNGATDEAVKFAKLLNIEIKPSDELLDKLEELNALPQKFSFGDSVKPKLKERLQGAIARKNAPRLFWCGLWLTAFSYFTFFPVYYIIAGGLMLMLAAVCLVFGKRR